MRLTCLNAWGGRMHAELSGWLAQNDPDILCIQEVVHVPGSPAPWLDYRDDGRNLPQRADMLADLATALPTHDITFCPAARGRLWHGEAQVWSQWGLATLTRRGLPVTHQAQGFVHGEFGAQGFGAHPRSRTGHAIRLWRPEGAVVIAHMHGLRDPEQGKADTPARAAQAARLAALVETIRQPGDEVVICGDFNVLPGSETLRTLSRLASRELVTEGDHPGTRNSLYTKPERHADYMMVSAGLSVSHFDVVHEPEVSDHCPLVLTLA
ncbi:endonuclease/exonuclease/phosphatase family protein [Vannielia litorea]|uniref:endonuclease/exonuclease/phosphatase family protein n=1 Tax=Vannielia litorea TaxID=1217970 RepID=UPI001BCCC957|nr:endonuclease/exonuclease/phosphatase family protein [Vannielia litorea]MBS8226249.1 endonuclease/exonuclease/phosphatase family protein [Vannielia litorea]